MATLRSDSSVIEKTSALALRMDVKGRPDPTLMPRLIYHAADCLRTRVWREAEMDLRDKRAICDAIQVHPVDAVVAVITCDHPAILKWHSRVFQLFPGDIEWLESLMAQMSQADTLGFKECWTRYDNEGKLYRTCDNDRQETKQPDMLMAKNDTPKPKPSSGPKPETSAEDVQVKRNINRLPSGEAGPRISFDPDEDAAVTERTAKLVEEVVVDLSNRGILSKGINISSTSKGRASKNHKNGDSVDINYIDGVHVEKSPKALKEVMDAFAGRPEVCFICGPLYCRTIYRDSNGASKKTEEDDKAAVSHKDHIHVQVKCN